MTISAIPAGVDYEDPAEEAVYFLKMLFPTRDNIKLRLSTYPNIVHSNFALVNDMLKTPKVLYLKLISK